MTLGPHLLRSLGLSLGLLLATTAHADEPSLDQAEQLLNQGQGKQALQLLQPQEAEQAGNARFDYLLGTAQLESGDAARATLTLERVLQGNPNHAGARLEMGRAYFALGDYSRARNEFETLQKLNPPPAAREAINAYLQEIDQRQRATQTRVSGYLESAIGRDTNINFATSKSTVYVPIFNSDLTLTEDSIAKADNMGVFAAGAELNHATSDTLGFFLGFDGKYRDFIHQKSSNFGTASLRTGATIGQVQNQLKFLLTGEKLRQNDLPTRDTAGGALEWRYMPRASSAITPFLQYNQLRYRQESNQANDVNQTVLGVGWLESIGGNQNTVAFVAGFGGRENAIHERADGDKRLLGLRAALQVTPLACLDLFVSAGVQSGQYDQVNYSFDETRRDRQTDSTVGLVWRMIGDVSVKPSINYTRNRSNLELNDYRRTEYLLTLRYDIR